MKNQTELVASCGLYCAECHKYKKGKCPGCRENDKAKWCKTRNCCIENSYSSCADCTSIEKLEECGKLNTFMSKLFGLIFRSDRLACLKFIKEKGYEEYTRHMIEKEQMTFKK